jgi:hypothetical protein
MHPLTIIYDSHTTLAAEPAIDMRQSGGSPRFEVLLPIASHGASKATESTSAAMRWKGRGAFIAVGAKLRADGAVISKTLYRQRLRTAFWRRGGDFPLCCQE